MMKKHNQKGNVLFLILIAVALFAALSYAVTQSSRSGGDSGRETNILNSAQLSQYPNAVRTAVLRMIIDGRTIGNLDFDKPASVATSSNGVFHPDGGGAVFQNAPSDMMDQTGTASEVNTAGVWYYNMEFEVPEIGLSGDASSAGDNDLVAFLPGVAEPVCQRINVEAGITTSTSAAVPYIGTDFSGAGAGKYDETMDGSYTAGNGVELDNTANDFTGHPFGCFRNDSTGTTPFVYYHVINER